MLNHIWNTRRSDLDGILTALGSIALQWPSVVNPLPFLCFLFFLIGISLLA